MYREIKVLCSKKTLSELETSPEIAWIALNNDCGHYPAELEPCTILFKNCGSFITLSGCHWQKDMGWYQGTLSIKSQAVAFLYVPNEPAQSIKYS